MFKPRERVFVPGASGEPAALTRQIFGTQNIHITTSFAAGVNQLSTEMIGAGSIVSGLFMQPALGAAQRQGQFRHLPFSYAAMIKHLRAEPGFDACVVQVSPPDAYGFCSLGPIAEFLPEILRRAGRIIAVLNHNVPRVKHAPVVEQQDIAEILEAETPLIGYDIGAPDAVSLTIAGLVARYIEDGAALQIGLGKVPQALMSALQHRRKLRLHSGMLSDGVMGLAAAGALDPDWAHTTTALLGSSALYAWAAGRDDIHIEGVEQTHDPRRLAGLDGLIAVNSALEIDLFGQCNLEIANGRAMSGVGGAADFARAARLAPGGISIVALPASFGSNETSRIKPWIASDGLVSLARTEADVIITEYGAADLRGRSVHERAAAIMAIATPSAQPGLEEAWRQITAKL